MPSSTTTRALVAPAPRAVARRRQPPGRALHARRRAAARREASPAASTSRCPAQDLRARGVLDARQRRSSSTASADDAREHERGARAARAGAASCARGGRRGGQGRSRSRGPQTCAYNGRLHVPDDLPVRAMSGTPRSGCRRRPPRVRSPTSRSTRPSGAPSRCCSRRRGQRQDARCSSSGSSARCASDGIAPGRILAITFTERAAGELRERVRARLLELGEREAARDTEAAFVGTFHGFCARAAARASARGGPRPRVRDPRRGPRRAPARPRVAHRARRPARGERRREARRPRRRLRGRSRRAR